MPLHRLYRDSLALLTDLYQLTMAYGYWKLGRAEIEAVFHLSFRHHPFDGGFSIACGLEPAVQYLAELRFDDDDLNYLRTLKGNDGNPLFPDAEFFDYLAQLKLTCDIDAIPEGTAVFPNEPLVRVRGPILQCQLLETPLLNLINFPTLVATKAARVCLAAKGDPVLEFGTRRAQGIDGSLAAARAAFVGGCAGTSNVLAGKLYGIPVGGTHAHSWVMSFDSELESFQAYASALPNNVTLLVDTFDTLGGVRHAIEVGKVLRAANHKLAAVRLDSGDLAYLSIEARKLLDAAGFTDTKILASNDLDEHLIESLKHQGAQISTWGVGTRLATAYDQPALGGVYKLSAIRAPSPWQTSASSVEPGEGRGEGRSSPRAMNASSPDATFDPHPNPLLAREREWEYKLKLSEQTIKISTPGVLGVRRYIDADGHFIADAIYDVSRGDELSREGATIVDPADMTRRKTIETKTHSEDLLVPIFRAGRRVYDPPRIEEARGRTVDQLERLHPTIKRFENPHTYPVGLEKHLHDLRTELILRARGRR